MISAHLKACTMFLCTTRRSIALVPLELSTTTSIEVNEVHKNSPYISKLHRRSRARGREFFYIKIV